MPDRIKRRITEIGVELDRVRGDKSLSIDERMRRLSRTVNEMIDLHRQWIELIKPVRTS